MTVQTLFSLRSSNPRYLSSLSSLSNLICLSRHLSRLFSLKESRPFSRLSRLPNFSSHLCLSQSGDQNSLAEDLSPRLRSYRSLSSTLRHSRRPPSAPSPPDTPHRSSTVCRSPPRRSSWSSSCPSVRTTRALSTGSCSPRLPTSSSSP